MPFHLSSGEVPALPELLALYGSVLWTAYTRDPDALERAVRHSGFVWTARAGSGENGAGELVGLIRGVTDDVSILYVQDILVEPGWQRRGVGRALMEAVLARYEHVGQMVLITDNGPEQLAFYGSLGFHNTRDLVNVPTNAFYRDRRVKLS